MGCFLACFGSKKEKEKERRRRKNRAKRVLPKDQRNGVNVPLQLNIQRNGHEVPLQPTISLNKDQENDYAESLQPTTSLNKDQEICDVPCQPTISLNKDTAEECITPIIETRYELEEQSSLSVRKKVTFDLNVKTYEGVSTQDTKGYTSEAEKESKDKEERGTKQSRSDSLSEDDSSLTSMGSFPSNHRYQNCSNSDDEYGAESEESDLDDDDDDDDDDDEDDEFDDYCDDDDDNDHQQIVHEESSESFFSLPSALQRHGSETPLAEKEVNSPLPRERKALKADENIRDRSDYLHSVLNPVENLTQWKAVKMRPKPPVKQRKENSAIEHELQIPFSSEPTFRFSPFSSNLKRDPSGSPKEDIAVDTSLSNWLGSSETTPSTKSSNLSFGFESTEGSKSLRSGSPRSHEDRPILGALTVEELRQFSATSSPRKSPSRSPDEMPILGTVGSYWSHTGQTVDSSSGSSCKGIPNTTSKYREDKRVNWHSTPFETRLERALNRGDAEAYPSK